MFSRADLKPCVGRAGMPGCGKLVRWTRTEAGAPFAVDPQPDARGNTAVWRDVTGVLRSRRITEERPLAPHEKRMMPHVATCKPRARQTPPPHGGRVRRPAAAAAPELYVVLGVERDAGVDDIKRAYRRLARQLHPDVNPSSEAAERFKEVTLAYDVLSDAKRRRLYDVTGRVPRPGRI